MMEALAMKRAGNFYPDIFPDILSGQRWGQKFYTDNYPDILSGSH